ncbi:hypothetical protein RchiOBHm_Chr4g0386701 [Rosa chinensis]|uniref:Uncharacterized protein n=1 Tax=Rosa chinensis TaxID=74649 RepID=A0A2P6QP94_ROSCH|nr:hypothetical protein RchiOBHm_Chr4g0386701 [Rosa chinensis]
MMVRASNGCCKVTSKHTLIYLDSGETLLMVRASKGCDLMGFDQEFAAKVATGSGMMLEL